MDVDFFHFCVSIDVCPGHCSGHGVCSTMGDVALFAGKDYDSTTENAGDGIGVVYKNWDANSLVMCKCDYGYFGASCELRKLLFAFLNSFIMYAVVILFSLPR